MSNPILEPTYNPTLLSRTSNLASDIAFFLHCPEATWQSHPAHTSLLLSRPQAFVEYITHLQALSGSADPSPLLAHTYVRYLGDLSGGQVIRRCIAKAYDIDVASGDGVKFYDFRSLDATKPSKMGDFKKIKEWFRAGMNSGVGDNKKLKGKQAG
jgi:heme oxygenase (biliverdin-producing, ferredoxin)